MKKLLTITSAMLFLILSVDVSTEAQNLSYSKVPRGSTYVVLDNHGKEIARFEAGQKTTMGGDCVS